MRFGVDARAKIAHLVKSPVIVERDTAQHLEGGASHAVPAIESYQSQLHICESVRFLLKFGFPKRMLERATNLSIENQTTAAQELIAFNGMCENTYYELLARHLGAVFVHGHQVTEVMLKSRNPLAALSSNITIWGRIDDGKLQNIIGPSPRMVQALENIAANGDPSKIIIVSPRELRDRVAGELQEEFTSHATTQLSVNAPLSSARFGATAWQGGLFVLFVLAIVGLILLSASATSLVLHVVFSLFFFACAALRMLATVQFMPTDHAAIDPVSDAQKPVYSVMIALHDEAEIVPDLIDAMSKLKWPRSKLEIKLVCEADDTATLSALESIKLDSRFDIIRVPPSEPRTKPKALNYALAFTSGKFVTLYDAEDRPHPQQLLEAYGKFLKSDEKVACLQAPLEGANYKRNFWPSMFYFEYAALFYGVIPWLSKRKAPILLGGTSNHFRRSALLDVMAWDPFNVTEDADLGLRLCRQGYRTDCITRPTYEDAPTTFGIWLPQRTRWFKGWMQTWIVQMRQPKILRQNMSWASFAIMHILLTGTIVSALIHPAVFGIAIYQTYLVFTDASVNMWSTRIAIFDWIILLCSYIGFIALAWRTSGRTQRQIIGWKTLLTPFYWLAISAASWRALFQLSTKPFYWEKTPHTAHEKE